MLFNLFFSFFFSSSGGWVEKNSFKSSPHFHVFPYASCVDLTQLLLQPNASCSTFSMLTRNGTVSYAAPNKSPNVFLVSEVHSHSREWCIPGSEKWGYPPSHSLAQATALIICLERSSRASCVAVSLRATVEARRKLLSSKAAG